MDDTRSVEPAPEVRAKLKTLVAESLRERELESIAKERDTLAAVGAEHARPGPA